MSYVREYAWRADESFTNGAFTERTEALQDMNAQEDKRARPMHICLAVSQKISP